MKQENKKKNILIFFLKMIVAYIIFEILMYRIYPILSEMIIYGKYGQNIIVEGICALLILIVLLLFGNSYIFTDKKEKFLKSVGVGAFIFGYATFMLFYSIIDLFKEGPINFIDIGSLALFCILIGIFEEFLCRGWILNEFIERFSSTRKQAIISIFLSSLIFGLIHISNIWVAGQSVLDTVAQILQATGIGVLLGTIYLRTKNIWAVAFLHGYWDFAIFLREINTIKECTTINVTLGGQITTIITSLIISLMFIVIGLYVFRKSKTKNIIKNELLSKEDIKKSEVRNELYIVAAIFLMFSLLLVPVVEDKEICYEYKEQEITYYEKSYSNYDKYIIDNKILLEITNDNKLLIKDLKTNNVDYFEKDEVSKFAVVESNNGYKILIRAINKEGNDTNIYYSDFITKNSISNDSKYLKSIIKSFVYLDKAPTTYEIGFIKSLDDNNYYLFIETIDSIPLVYFENDFYILKQKEVEYKIEKVEQIPEPEVQNNYKLDSIASDNNTNSLQSTVEEE